MSRLRRMQRIRTLLEVEERRTRLAAGQANRELTEASARVEDVMAQCRRVAAGSSQGSGVGAGGSDLPVAAVGAVLRSGWLETTHREAEHAVAAQTADERRSDWREAHRRHDAVGRVIDRWRDAADERHRVAESKALDDAIAARTARPMTDGSQRP